MIHVVAVTSTNKVQTNISLKKLKENDWKWYWVDFDQPTEEEIKELENTFQFHPLAIEDCIHRLQRPKLDYYEEYNFFVTHCLEEGKLSKEEVNFFLSKNYIVSFHHVSSKSIHDVWLRLNNEKEIKRWNPHFVLYHLIDKFVDNYFPIVYKIEDELNQLENNTDQLSMEDLLEQLFDIRHYLLKLRHTVLPMRDLIYRMINSTHLTEIKRNEKYFSDIHDHLLKLTEMIEANRELTTDIRDNYLSINSHQTNKVMRVLTVITTIFMPLTFIAGVYGMNFGNMPELQYKYGYFLTLSLMLVIGVSMFIWFKKKGWFK
jgi:magnesium transporter